MVHVQRKADVRFWNDGGDVSETWSLWTKYGPVETACLGRRCPSEICLS